MQLFVQKIRINSTSHTKSWDWYKYEKTESTLWIIDYNYYKKIKSKQFKLYISIT